MERHLVMAEKSLGVRVGLVELVGGHLSLTWSRCLSVARVPFLAFFPLLRPNPGEVVLCGHRAVPTLEGSRPGAPVYRSGSIQYLKSCLLCLSHRGTNES